MIVTLAGCQLDLVILSGLAIVFIKRAIKNGDASVSVTNLGL